MAAEIRWVDTAASTNSLLTSEAAGLAHGAVIAAREQSAGRGQRGNSWEAEPGKNLTFSLLLRPQNIAAANQFELSMIVALGVCEALECVSGKVFKVKWPNDIYYGDKKVCGILIENVLEGRRIAQSIAGIGINVNQQTFLSDAPNPVSLVNITGRETKLESLLQRVCDIIISRLEQYESSPDASGLTAEYRRHLWRGEGVWTWTDCLNDTELRASIADVAADGYLTLRDDNDNLHRFAFKEVAAVL